MGTYKVINGGGHVMETPYFVDYGRKGVPVRADRVRNVRIKDKDREDKDG